MSTGGKEMFSIFDPAKRSGTWVRLNESGYDFAVKKYEADSETVTVEHQGRTHTLVMRVPKIASSGNAVPPPPTLMPVPAANTPPNPVTRNVTVNPTPQSEAARMADWSAEIQRRRDMRAQAASGQPQQPAQMTPAQPVQPQVEQVRPQNDQGNQRQRNQQRQRAGQ